MKSFSSILAAWYKKNKRDLPWRGTKDPYKVWLSEIILQQTRVEQGMSYYFKFTETFPTVKDLANAKEDEVLKLWQGLGYYSRARNLHAAAKQIVSSEFRIMNSESGALNKKTKNSQLSTPNSEFPNSFDQIILLKGVGTYTASAISSICFNEAKAVVDGNVYRFIARVFGIKTPIDSTKGKKEFQEMADALLDEKNPGEHNQAMMEFGARHCKPANPLCGKCPFEEMCVARRKNLIAQLPVKEKKIKTRKRYLEYFAFDYKGKTFLRQRSNPKDIWQGLYEFPLIEFASQETEKKILAALQKEYVLSKSDFVVKEISAEIKHVLSHQDLHARFHKISLKKIPAKLKKEFLLLKREEVNDYALPRLIDRYWN